MYALAAGNHTAALERRLTALLRHKCWDRDDDGKWVRSLLTHVVSHFGLGFGHVAKDGSAIRPVVWDVLEAACCAVETELQQAQVATQQRHNAQ
jgi:hypothetical protein